MFDVSFVRVSAGVGHHYVGKSVEFVNINVIDSHGVIGAAPNRQLDHFEFLLEDSTFERSWSTVSDASALQFDLRNAGTATYTLRRNVFLANTSMGIHPTGSSDATIKIQAGVPEVPIQAAFRLEDNVFDSNVGLASSLFHASGWRTTGLVTIDVVGGAMYRNGWHPQTPSPTQTNWSDAGALFATSVPIHNTEITLHDVDLGLGPNENIGDLIPGCRPTGIVSGVVAVDDDWACP